MSEHATLAPSSAEQWGHCAGSVRAQAAFPDTETEATREGTAAHWVMAEVLEAYKRGAVVSCQSFEGLQAPNGLIIDDKMVEGAEVIVDSVIQQVESLSRKVGRDLRGYLLVEFRVYMPNIHPTENWGTLDVALYVPELGLLFIWDYKHGHRDCQAEGNLQIVDYLAGLVERFQIDGLTDQKTTVIARIVQPFCYYARGPIKDWVFRLSDLRGWWNKLHAQAHEALSDNPRLNTGRWCRDCKAVGVCSAARMAGYNFVDMVNEPYLMDEMTGADLSVERNILQDGIAVAKARLEAIEDNLTHRVQRGESDSGLALETSKGREQWTIPTKQVIALCGQLGVDASKEAVKTPKQTRDAAPKETRPVLEQIMAKVVQRKAGALKLVPAADTKAARAFQPK